MSIMYLPTILQDDIPIFISSISKELICITVNA
jgi:hypothetical protein